jgi:predicted ATP-dependent serine protease
MDTTDSELNRVQAVSFPDPMAVNGIGKSAIASNLIEITYKTLYVSGEESQKTDKIESRKNHDNK